MWSLWVSVAAVSIAGAMVVDTQVRALAAVDAPGNAALAANMAAYKEAVVKYVTANPGFVSGSVSDAALVFPPWYAAQSPALWRNYVGADRTVTVYASPVPDRDILPEILALSNNSVLVGKASANTLRAPADNTGRPALTLPVAGGTALVPEGSPVWIAMPN